VYSETNLVKTQFRAAASNRVLAVEREMDSALRMARATGAFLSKSSDATAGQLAEFIDSMQGSNAIPMAIAYRSHSRALMLDPENLIARWPETGSVDAAGFVSCRTAAGGCLLLHLYLARRDGDDAGLTLILPMAQLAERGLSYLSPFGVDLRLSSEGEIRFEHLSRMRKLYRGSFWETLRGGVASHQAEWRFLNLTLHIDCTAVPGYLIAASTWQPWGVLASGLFATLLLALLFGSLLSHAEGVEKMVSSRTAELELARDEAIQASILKSRFLANVSHEVRTPLNGVLGMTQFLLDTSLNREQRDCAITIKESGEILLHLMNDLLDLSRIEAGQLSLNVIHFDLGHMIQTVVDNVAESAFRKGLQFELSYSPNVGGQLYADPVRLGQVLMNLLGNAAKFTSEGSVSLHLACLDSKLRFEVSDTGPGMEASLIHRLFERFVQGDSSSVRRFGGAGLGLAISRELVQLMGGRIWVESALGSGSKFSFEIPLDEVSLHSPPIELSAPRRYRPDSALPAPQLAVVSSPSSGTVILVAEDNLVNQKVTVGMLRKLGFGVDLAADGREAVEAHLSRQYPLILMDCQMPGMDGYEATRIIRSIETASSRTPIIALTANAMIEDVQRCLDADMDDHLSKPLSLNALRSALDRWCPKMKSPENEIAEQTVKLAPPLPQDVALSSSSELCSEPS